MNVLDYLYQHVADSLTSASFYTNSKDGVKRGNLIEYSTEEKNKKLNSSYDYPKIEIRYLSVESDGATSNSAKYRAKIKILVRTGENTYQQRLTPIMFETLQICDTLKRWEKSFDDGSKVSGIDNTGISQIGKYYDEDGSDEISGWSFEIDLTFIVFVPHVNQV
ncbi:MAG: hypothetical protein IJQ39_02000 [Thermoguttaceae bacterium]|nr:hypothetical protein [Thermoguttaceae bacterium]